MASTHNGRGYLRSGRSPPFLVVSLLVVICILAYNYWNSASSNSELRNSVNDLEDRLRLYNLKKTSLEKRNEALIQRVRETDRQLEDSKAKYSSKDTELGAIRGQLQEAEDQLDSVRQEKGTIEAEASGARKELESLQARFQELQGQHNALAEEMQQQQQDNDRKVQEKLEFTSMQCKQQMEAANAECDGKLREVADRYSQLQALYSAAQQQAPQLGAAVPNQDPQEAQLHQGVVQMNQQLPNLAANIRTAWESLHRNMTALLITEQENTSATTNMTQSGGHWNNSAAQEQPIITGLTWAQESWNHSELYSVQNVTGQFDKPQAVHGVQQQLADQQQQLGGVAAAAQGQEGGVEGVGNIQPPGAGEMDHGHEGEAAEAGEEGQQEGENEQVDDYAVDADADDDDDDDNGDVNRAEDYVYGDGEEPQEEAKDTMFQEGGDAGERAEEGGPAQEQGEHLEGGHAGEEGVLGEHGEDELVQEEHMEGGHAGEDNEEELQEGDRGDGDAVEYNEDDEGADDDHIGNNEIPDDEKAAEEQNQQIIKEENEGVQEYYHDNQIVPHLAEADRDLDMQGGDGEHGDGTNLSAGEGDYSSNHGGEGDKERGGGGDGIFYDNGGRAVEADVEDDEGYRLGKDEENGDADYNDEEEESEDEDDYKDDEGERGQVRLVGDDADYDELAKDYLGDDDDAVDRAVNAGIDDDYGDDGGGNHGDGVLTGDGDEGDEGDEMGDDLGEGDDEDDNDEEDEDGDDDEPEDQETGDVQMHDAGMPGVEEGLPQVAAPM
ncbi:PREDICTED: uncharacterized protein DDB_G0290685-like isoform X2 [Branchiostoma belcheri]|uniref:Uncharacterized protein DDB_G0290685-like isoform X2 n=1 Tax=Branchiostoma belcheri TaxID=7741 RepID=A0A6P4YYA6_BRABE|nr:PREDICTED: uncharacterized protein DDB_G0290685-like isoform X2 [Branchiostoma belcheri]